MFKTLFFRARIAKFLTTFLAVLSFSLFTDSRAFALSIEEERVLGQRFVAYVRQNFELVNDDFTNRYLGDLGEYLTSFVEVRYFPFRFYLLKDDNLNAFAAPGGHIFVFTGLVEALKTVDELAAVISHEIGHVSARHLARRMEQSKKLGLAAMAGVLAGMLLGGKAAGALVAGSLAAKAQAELHYSRNDERQADQFSLKYMKPSGFDPAGMIEALTAIEKGSWWGTNQLPPYLLTHPTGPERISNLETMLRDFHPGPPKAKTRYFRELYPFFRAILRAKSMEFHEAERLFTLDIKKDPSSPSPYLGLGILYKEKSNYSQALQYLQSALEKAPASVLVMKTIAKVYQDQGQDKKAVRILEKALRKDDGDRDISYLLALSYENMEHYDKALLLLNRLASRPPVKNEVYYHLGISYGRQRKLALAHYNFGRFFEKTGEPDKALFHFQKAAEYAGNDMALKERIHRATSRVMKYPRP